MATIIPSSQDDAFDPDALPVADLNPPAGVIAGALSGAGASTTTSAGSEA